MVNISRKEEIINMLLEGDYKVGVHTIDGIVFNIEEFYVDRDIGFRYKAKQRRVTFIGYPATNG